MFKNTRRLQHCYKNFKFKFLLQALDDIYKIIYVIDNNVIKYKNNKAINT